MRYQTRKSTIAMAFATSFSMMIASGCGNPDPAAEPTSARAKAEGPIDTCSDEGVGICPDLQLLRFDTTSERGLVTGPMDATGNTTFSITVGNDSPMASPQPLNEQVSVPVAIAYEDPMTPLQTLTTEVEVLVSHWPAVVAVCFQFDQGIPTDQYYYAFERLDPIPDGKARTVKLPMRFAQAGDYRCVARAAEGKLGDADLRDNVLELDRTYSVLPLSIADATAERRCFLGQGGGGDYGFTARLANPTGTDHMLPLDDVTVAFWVKVRKSDIDGQRSVWKLACESYMARVQLDAHDAIELSCNERIALSSEEIELLEEEGFAVTIDQTGDFLGQLVLFPGHRIDECTPQGSSR